MNESSFLATVRAGRPDFGVLEDFPQPGEAEEERLSRTAASLATVLDRLDRQELPRQIDRTGELPAELIGELADRGFLKMLLGPELGGLGLSVHDGFRVVQAAAGYSATVGMFLAIHNALGVGSFLPTMPPRPLRDFIADRLTAGKVAGMASTEREGAANHRRSTVAVPVPDGSGYLINGEKLYISNGAIAGILSVTATVMDLDGRRDDGVGIFFFDTASPGFSVTHRQRFMGLAGSPNAVIRFTDMFVPAEQLLADPRGAWRTTSPYLDITTVARSYITAAVALGVAGECLRWSRAFAARRVMNGRPLASYDAIERLVATSAAEVFAMDTVVRWTTLGGGSRARQSEFDAMKNLLTLGSWRVADSTLSLFGGEGYETADSKAARGAEPVPVEQAVRDLRGLRVAGGVDFYIDNQLGGALLRGYYTDRDSASAVEPDLAGSALYVASSERNRRHLVAVAAESARLAGYCGQLAKRYREQELLERQLVPISVNRIADEIFAMSVCLARASADPRTAPLADVYCVAAAGRLLGYWHALDVAADAAGGPDYRAAAAIGR